MKYYRLNNKINAPLVRLIDEKDEHVGEIKTEKALQIAQEKKLDLVEISPKANPPVAKIMDFGQFKYDLKKKDKKDKKQQKISNVVKGIRITPRISQHDLEMRAKKSNEFLSKGNKVRIEMILRGREKAHFDLAKEKVQNFINLMEGEINIDQPPKRQGNQISAVISPSS